MMRITPLATRAMAFAKAPVARTNVSFTALRMMSVAAPSVAKVWQLENLAEKRSDWTRAFQKCEKISSDAMQLLSLRLFSPFFCASCRLLFRHPPI